MKKLLSLLCALTLLLTLFSACSKKEEVPVSALSATGENPSIGGDDDSFGEALASIGIYDGYFTEETVDIQVTCLSGSADAYTLSGNVLTFTSLAADSVYAVSGRLKGSIVIDVGDAFQLELELRGLSLVSTEESAIRVDSGDKVTLTAKKDYTNYIYDMREAVDENDTAKHPGAVYAMTDLEIGGKGSLFLYSQNNKGVHTKDDLEIKNLNLTVACRDNALKGNDSVSIRGGSVTLIATGGDGIKTQNSDVSEKGKQRGTVDIADSKVTIYAACDGIDASYDITVTGESTVLSIYTDKYSNYSEEVTATDEAVFYLRNTDNSLRYSVKYANADGTAEWVNADYHSTVSGGRSVYYYYSFPKKAGYEKMQLFIYDSGMEQGQESDYLAAGEPMTPNSAYDTLALSYRNGAYTYNWTNYTTSVETAPGGRPGGPGGGPGGPGGMNEGNKDKGEYSTKGLKAANQITVGGGEVCIKSYDDGMHANSDSVLENGSLPLGNVTVSGGSVAIYSNDDGIHADGAVQISGGDVTIVNSYEGIEGSTVTFSGGTVSVSARDDGVNATATTGTGVTLSGGFLYIYCTGDGIDSNSRTAYAGISFAGGNAVILSNSGGNSAIDTEQGYCYTGGCVVAIMPRGGMTGEAVHCQSFSSVGSTKSLSFSAGKRLTVTGDMSFSFEAPCGISNAYVVLLNQSLDISG